MECKSNRNVVFSCKYHVVWCPKYRRRVLVDGVDGRLKAILEDVAKETRSEILEMEVMPDHVQEFPRLALRLPALWTNSYFVSTVGGAPLAVVKQYIESQKRSEVR